MAKKVKTIREIVSAEKVLLNEQHLISLAANCYKFEGLPEKNGFFDWEKINTWLVTCSKVAFFYDDVMQKYICLPFDTRNRVDIYGRPKQIVCYSENTYHIVLNKKDCVIIYDNSEKISIMPFVRYTAERLALCDRILDYNIFQQKNPRIFTIPKNQEASARNVINEIDTFAENILTYENFDLNEINSILAPVPYIAAEVEEIKRRLYSDFLQKIGVCSVVEQKRERMIKDEIYYNQGGAVLSRQSRENSRKKAVAQINKKYGLNMTVHYFQNEEILQTVTEETKQTDIQNKKE